MTLQNIAVALLSVFFLFASSIKILGWQKNIFEAQLAMFIKYGFNRQIMALTGCAELFGAIAVWIQHSWLAALGALALLGTSTGAIFCHLVFDSWKEGVLAIITGTLSTYLAWTYRTSLLELFS